MKPPEKPWAMAADEVASALGVDAAAGLDDSEAANRLASFGRNELRHAQPTPWWRVLAEQFRSLLVVLLLGGAALSFAFSEWVEGGAIVAVILLNATIGFVTEIRAVRSMEGLRELGNVDSTVRRGGALRTIDAEELVPGDTVIVEGGDVITADLRLMQASRLQVDESALTGESVPVSKSVASLPENAELSDRENMLFKGTAVTRGHGEAVVVGTGMQTELGRITELVAEAEESRTPLEERLDKLGRKLAYACLGFVVLVGLVGIATGRDLYFMVQTAIALAVATVPEGLPIVATIALARGMWRMAKRNALIDDLGAVETLGSTNVILTDKTGTLTENQMTVVRIVAASADGPTEYEVTGGGLETIGEFHAGGHAVDPHEDVALRHLLETAALCTDAELQESGAGVGDPMEVALLVAAAKAGLHRPVLREKWPLEDEEAFDPDLKLMATIHRADEGYLYAVKGAPEAVLEACTGVDDRDGWHALNECLAAEGHRMLAIARKVASSADGVRYEGLSLLGIVALLDPPRTDVLAAIEACRAAGIRVVMVTGDQAPTALHVGRAVGLARPDDTAIRGQTVHEAEGDEQAISRVLAATVVARTSPEQKLELIADHQRDGDVVAMIGDGVNDAPALRKADIGVAMGRRGTQVAREAADMVLQDDRFATIVAAIEEGRVIFANIRKFVVYLISCNLSEIIVIGAASLVAAPLPLLPLQILFLNLVTDVFPALALGVGGAYTNVMAHPPREPSESIVTRRLWLKIFGSSLLLAVCVLAGFALALGVLEWDETRAVTLSFLILACGQLAHVFNMAEPDSGRFRNEVTRNRWVWGAVGLCLVLILGGVYVPGIREVLGVRPPDLIDWAIVGGLSLVPVVVGRLLPARLR